MRDADEEINSFSIVPKVYEKKLDDRYGIKLGSLENGLRSEFNGSLNHDVYLSNRGTYLGHEIEERILEKYKSVPGFCSMKVKNKKELMKHVETIHELSYGHYVFGKERNLRGDFPNRCCGVSARNLLLTLMEKGYPNASMFTNVHFDHTYNALPFLFGEKEEKGFIIVDPTSDQLFERRGESVRNNLFVVSGMEWEYRTDWRRGADLFPKISNDSKFSNLEMVRNNPKASIPSSKYIGKYFREVFENGVDVDVEAV